MEKKKRKEKTVRRFIAFLAAACMLGTMPGVSAVSYAEESFGESLETYGAGADGQEESLKDSAKTELKDEKVQTDDSVQEAGDTVKGAENQEDTEEKDTEDKKTLEESDRKDMENKGGLEESEETKTENKVDKDGTEESKDQENTEKEDIEDMADKEKTEDEGDSGEAGADKEDIPNVGDSEEGEKSGEVSGEEQDAESEKADADENTTGEGITKEEEIIADEEIAEDEEMVADEEADDEVETEEAKEDIEPLAAEPEESATVEEDTTYTDENGVIYHYYAYDDGTAEIYKLENYKESAWVYKALDIPAQIGDYTVTRLTFAISSTTPKFPSVTIPETVTYMEGSLFKNISITELHYNAEAAKTGASYEGTGVFSSADIGELYIGENVEVIPDYCFSFAKITVDELTLNVERIGDRAFIRNKTITTLTIGEDVRAIGDEAFANNQIENLNYLAVNAIESAKYGQAGFGTFRFSSVSNITIGDKVTMIPEHLFHQITYTADTLEFPDCLTTFGKMAFYGSDITIGELTIGENVTSIGENAFTWSKIGNLNYNAIDARLDGGTESDIYSNPFEGTEIGELRIGEHVEKLPDTLFHDIYLDQDTLTLPDSITYIGSYVLANHGGIVKIGTLEIGENVTHIGRAAFGGYNYDKMVVRTVEADIVPETDVDLEHPICGEVVIHGKSPYYEYFTKKTSKDCISLLCEDFETTYGEEYYDAEKESFVTPITDACTVCGYGVTREEYSEAYTVIFTDYDGRELSRQNLHKGEDATAPNDPERTGYRFMGWDKGFTNVTADLTVRAEYEIRKFSVVFKDGDRIISEQEVSYEGSAKAPANPTRQAEEWGTWRFTGWSGNYTHITKDEVITALFEKVFKQYIVLFYDSEENVISRQIVAHGEAAKEPEAPEKEATAQYHYTFTGWSADTESITGNTDFYPVYDTETRFYTVTFQDGSIVLDTQTVEYGDDATTPADPAREEEEWGSWRFTGWRGSYTHIVKDEVIRAVFEKVLNEYEVIFYDADDNILSRQTVKHGMGAEVPEAPAIEPTEEECYVFTGWDGDVSHITEESRFHPLYETKTRTYTVTFMSGDTVHDVQEVEYGQSAATPQAPSRKEDASYTYKFVGWDQDFSFITGDLTVQAVFEPVKKPKDDEKEKEKPEDKEPGGQEPGDGDGDDGGNGGTDGEPDGGGTPDGEPEGEGGEETPDPVPEILTKINILSQGAKSQVVKEKEPVFQVPEIPEKSIQTEEKSVQTEEQETLQEVEEPEVEKERRQIPVWLWLLLLLGAGTGILHVILLCLFDEKRTVCGTVLDGDGKAMRGTKVSLAGQDEETIETQIDKNGQYMFAGLEKDDYRLCLCGRDASSLLLLDIRMGRWRRKKVFAVFKSNVGSVKTKRKGRKYQIDVTV